MQQEMLSKQGMYKLWIQQPVITTETDNPLILEHDEVYENDVYVEDIFEGRKLLSPILLKPKPQVLK